jgi:hypothetical protein
MVADVVPRHMCVYSYTARVCDKDKVRTRYYSSLFTPCLYARKHLKGLNLNTSLFPADAVRELEQATFLVIKAWIRREPTALTPKNVGRDRAILSAWPRRYRQQVPTPRYIHVRPASPIRSSCPVAPLRTMRVQQRASEQT